MIDKIASASMKIFNKRIKQFALIFNYHRVTNDVILWEHPAINTEVFEKQIVFLMNNYNILPLKNMLSNNFKIPSNGKPLAAITFDDGYRDIYDFAFPILKKYKISATIFVASSYIEERRMFWWDYINYLLNHLQKSIQISGYGTISMDNPSENYKNLIVFLSSIQDDEKSSVISKLEKKSDTSDIDNHIDRLIITWDMLREMNSSIFTIGAHTHTHPLASRISDEQLKSEIELNINMVKTHTDNTPDIFAYPSGKPKDYTQKTISVLKNCGIDYAFTTKPDFVRLKKLSTDYKYIIGRVNVSNEYWKFVLQAAGIYSLIKKY